MADPVREQILARVATLAALVRTANGYYTECGILVERCRRSFEPDELTAGGAIAVWDGQEESIREYSVTAQTMTMNLEAHGLFGSTNRSTHANRMLADLRKCLETYDATLGGLMDGIRYAVGAIEYPDDGGSSVSVNAQFEITYRTVRGAPASKPS